MSKEKYFLESKKTDNFVELIKDRDDNIWINKYYVDNSEYDSILEFCNILKHAFETAKQNGGKYHSQYVNKTDFKIIDDRWEIISELNNIYHMQCSIDDAPTCVIEAFFDGHV